jgi:competence protein ComEA
MGFVRKQLLIYVAIGVVVVAIGARFLLSGHSSGASAGSPGVELGAASPGVVASSGVAAGEASPAAGQPGGSTTAASPGAPAEVVVDVAGAVVRPGVYTLPAGARVCDALDLAGGTTARAQTAAVNLAARLIDGQQIVIPEEAAPGAAGQVGGASGAGAAGASPSGSGAAGSSGGTASGAAASTTGAPVNLNTATLEQLDALSGVGPSTAQKIIDYREEHGGFRSVEELMDVSGIGDAKFAALKDQVTI